MPQIGQETQYMRTSFRISRRRFVRKTRHFETTPHIRCRVAVYAANSRGITEGICKGWKCVLGGGQKWCDQMAAPENLRVLEYKESLISGHMERPAKRADVAPTVAQQLRCERVRQVDSVAGRCLQILLRKEDR